MASISRTEIPVIVDSKKLVLHTLKVTQNLNNFPKKYRYTLVDKLIRSSMDIYDYVSDANLSWGGERIQKQNEAIRSCRKMKFYLQCVYEVLKPQCSIPYWADMINNLERQIIGWRSATVNVLKKNK